METLAVIYLVLVVVHLVSARLMARSDTAAWFVGLSNIVMVVVGGVLAIAVLA